MRCLFAAVIIVTILSACAPAKSVVPTPTNIPRPTVTPLGPQNSGEVATQIVSAEETEAFLPTATSVKIAPPTKALTAGVTPIVAPAATALPSTAATLPTITTAHLSATAPLPTVTATHLPAAGSLPTVTATHPPATSVPSPTATTASSPTVTPVPSPTVTPASSPTVTPVSSPTTTPVPSPTMTPVSTFTSTISGAGLLVWYDFEGDFSTTGIVTDRTGQGHDAQASTAVATTDGVSGGHAILFTGNEYIQALDNPASERNNVTFSLWFKTDHPEIEYELASAALSQDELGSGWVMATSMPQFWSEDTQSLIAPGQANADNHFPANAWVHEVVTYDGSRIKEYTNGELVNDWSTTGANLGGGLAMAVGGWPQYPDLNFHGSIDEFKIFDRALTPLEVRILYNQNR